MAFGKPLEQAILDGAWEIALPAFVSTLCIRIVFVPMFFLTGVARHLFVPLAEAVVFAMLASYLLSRTPDPHAGDVVLPECAALRSHGGHGADPEWETGGTMIRKREVARARALDRTFQRHPGDV